MRYLKIYERYGYSNVLYYYSDIMKIVDKKWYDIKIQKNGTIQFNVENIKEIYEVYFEKNIVALEKSEDFCKKLKSSLNTTNIKDVEIDLKCLGDISHLRKARDFNL